MIERYGRDKRGFDTVVLARATETWTGAEIEQALVEALYGAFADGGREPTAEDIGSVINGTTPLYTTMAERVGHLRQWAKGRARNAAEETAL